jgi:hypothetical protein
MRVTLSKSHRASVRISGPGLGSPNSKAYVCMAKGPKRGREKRDRFGEEDGGGDGDSDSGPHCQGRDGDGDRSSSGSLRGVGTRKGMATPRKGMERGC